MLGEKYNGFIGWQFCEQNKQQTQHCFTYGQIKGFEFDETKVRFHLKWILSLYPDGRFVFKNDVSDLLVFENGTISERESKDGVVVIESQNYPNSSFVFIPPKNKLWFDETELKDLLFEKKIN